MNRETQRGELHKTIWRIANDLRGSVDGWDFKQYVLGFLFYRYISENLTAYLNTGEREAGHLDFDYANVPNTDVSDRSAPRSTVDAGWTPGCCLGAQSRTGASWTRCTSSN